MMNTGHVYVVRAALQAVDAEIVVVPTDSRFSVNRKWHDLLPAAAAALRPADWRIGAALPAAMHHDSAGPEIWFIDSAWHSGESPESVVNKISRGVEKIITGTRGKPRSRGRSKPLVALPTLGVGRGGLGDHRGALIRQLLRSCRDAAEAADVDVVIAAYNSSDHAAFQHERRQSPSELPDDLDKVARRIAEQARLRELALFLGAGVSMSAGLPSWGDLMRSLGPKIGLSQEERAKLNPLDLAELISRNDDDFRAAVVEQIQITDRPGLSHQLLAGLGCEEAVTTNFDVLYERAASLPESEPVAVLPWQRLDRRRRWVLKMHGDVDHREQIVLTRGDFVRYDAASGPAGAAVQALMLSRHLLVVGASLTDDNFLRLAHEVQYFLEQNDSSRGVLGTVLSLGANAARTILFKGVFDFVDVTPADPNDQPRALTLVLDAAAMHASQDMSFFLDPRYRGLVPLAETELLQQVQTLYPQIGAAAAKQPTSGWAHLRRALEAFGARIEE